MKSQSMEKELKRILKETIDIIDLLAVTMVLAESSRKIMLGLIEGKSKPNEKVITAYVQAITFFGEIIKKIEKKLVEDVGEDIAQVLKGDKNESN